MTKNLKITQVKSTIGSPRTQRNTMNSLDLKKVRQSVVYPDDPAVCGQVYKVRHLITAEEID